MTEAGRLFLADRQDARLFAYVATSRFTVAEVATSRLGASLHPFPDEASARAALEDAGGADIREA